MNRPASLLEASPKPIPNGISAFILMLCNTYPVIVTSGGVSPLLPPRSDLEAIAFFSAYG